MAAFIPGESPPEVKIPIFETFPIKKYFCVQTAKLQYGF
jgi:hypothetical protein